MRAYHKLSLTPVALAVLLAAVLAVFSLVYTRATRSWSTS